MVDGTMYHTLTVYPCLGFAYRAGVEKQMSNSLLFCVSFDKNIRT